MKTRCIFLFAVLFTALIVRAEDTVLLRGTVLDDTGKPVAGAQVYLEEDVLKSDKIRTTNEDGRFELPVPSDKVNQWMSVYVVSPDRQRLGQDRPKLKEGVLDIPEMAITLKKARIITGTVVNADGKPVGGALVGGVDQTPYPNFTKTDKDGNFRFAYPDDDVVPMQQVFAYHEKAGLDYLCTEELEKYRGKIPPEKKSDGSFRLTLQPLKEFKFRVVDEEKNPILGCEVYPWLIRKESQPDSFNTGFVSDLFTGKTDADGMVTTMSIGNTRFSAYGPKEGVAADEGKRIFYGSDDKRLEEFEKSDPIPAFVLKRKGNVKGTVKRPDGTPVSWSQVTIKRHNACGHGIVWSNAQGEFTFDWGKAGELFDIGVESTLGAAPGVYAFNVGNGIEEKRLDFTLQKGIRLHGTVYDPEGKPSEQYQIFLYEKCPEDMLKKIQESLLSLKTETETENTCPPDGCATGIVIRQTSDYGEPGSQGKYEYFLPAVGRKYDFSVSSYADPELKFRQEDFTVKGDETEIRLDFHLKKREDE